jgi:hypothetical protein
MSLAMMFRLPLGTASTFTHKKKLKKIGSTEASGLRGLA